MMKTGEIKPLESNSLGNALNKDLPREIREGKRENLRKFGQRNLNPDRFFDFDNRVIKGLFVY